MDTIIFIGAIAIGLIWFFRQASEYSFNEDPKTSDYLPWGYLVEEGIIFNKNGSYQKTFKIQGKDRKSLEIIDMIDLRAKINNAFKTLDGDVAIHIESRRIKAQPYQKGNFKELLLQMIDKVREDKYNSGTFYVTEYYLTITWLPPVDLINKIQDKLILDETQETKALNNYLKEYKALTKEFIFLIKNYFIKIESLDDDETITYLHSCFSKNYKLKAPSKKGIFLDSFISDIEIIDGIPPKVGDDYLGVISLLNLPTESYFSMMSEIEELGIEFRAISRFIIENKEDSLETMRRKKGKWASKRKSVLDAVEDKIMKEDRVTNYAAALREEEAEDVMKDLQNDEYNIGKYTFTVICKDKDLDKLNHKLDQIVEIIQNKGFVCIKESIDLLQPFFGSMPGDIQHNLRQTPLPSIIVMDLFQFTSIYSGNKENTHLKDLPHIICNATKGTTASYLNLNVGDVGHTAIYGRTGSGKSVFLAFLAAQWKKYKDSQVFIFDKGGSSRVLTAAVGGVFNDLGSTSINFQPLRNIGIVNGIEDKEKIQIEMGFAYEWLIDIYEYENLTLTTEFKDEIKKALDSVAKLPEDRRTITSFSLALQNHTLRTAIKPYTNDGVYGVYFDSNKDNFNSENLWQVFEMDKIIENKGAVKPMLSYMFHKLEQEMFTKGRPTLLILDEVWRLLDDDKFCNKIKMWLKELRKKKVYVVFATQELSDIFNSPIKDTLINSCPTTIFLPNKQAGNSVLKPLYKELGLNNKQIDIIANLIPKMDYYVVNELGNLDIRPNFSEFEIAFLGASSSEDQNKCLEIEEELKNLPEKEKQKEFIKKWLKYKKIDFLEKNLENLLNTY